VVNVKKGTSETGPAPKTRVLFFAALSVGGCVAIMLISAFGLTRYYHSQEAKYLRETYGLRAELMEKALTGAVGAHLRRNLYRPEELNEIFFRMSAMPMFRALALYSGTEIIAASDNPVTDAPESRDTSPDFAFSFDVDGFHQIYSGPGAGVGTEVHRRPGEMRRRSPHQPAGRGGGPGRWWQQENGSPPPSSNWVELPAGPYRISVVMDGTAYLSHRQTLRIQVLLMGAGILILYAVAVLLIFLRRRQRGLQMQLLNEQARAAHHEKLARLGAGLAHETKNPLGIVRGLAQAIGDSPGLDEKVREKASHIVDEADRVTGRLNTFLGFAHPREPAFQPVALNVLIADILALIAADAESGGIRLRNETAPLTVRADPDQLRRALLNLLLNAIRATAPGGEITIRAGRDRGGIRLEIADTGCGIKPEDLPRVREPYYTRFEGGTGLGLAIVDEIAEAHGWNLAIESAPGKGTRVRLSGLRKADDT
jgi:signal transduction histidine kinase